MIKTETRLCVSDSMLERLSFVVTTVGVDIRQALFYNFIPITKFTKSI